GRPLASLIALGYKIDHIHELYKEHVPRVMAQKSATAKTAALNNLAQEVFKGKTFEDVMTGVGIVTTRWMYLPHIHMLSTRVMC
ncbi:MAG: hypothetical protein Q8Q40_10525, partial [Methylococcaceae bacterium]|nr:hypothetical protein [Methylococcaceae bacterium]